jgi:hypothetical protein
MPGSPRVQPGDKYNLSYAAVVTKSFDDIAALTQSPPCTTLTVMSAELPGSAAGLPGFPPPSPPPSPPPEYDDYDGDGYDDVVGALDDDGSDGHITDKQVSDDGDLGRVAPEYDDYDGDGYDDDVGALDDQPADDDHANEQHDEPYDTEDEERSGVKWSDVWPDDDRADGEYDDGECSHLTEEQRADLEQKIAENEKILAELEQRAELELEQRAKLEEQMRQGAKQLEMACMGVAMMSFHHMQMCNNLCVSDEAERESECVAEKERRKRERRRAREAAKKEAKEVECARLLEQLEAACRRDPDLLYRLLSSEKDTGGGCSAAAASVGAFTPHPRSTPRTPSFSTPKTAAGALPAPVAAATQGKLVNAETPAVLARTPRRTAPSDSGSWWQGRPTPPDTARTKAFP